MRSGGIVSVFEWFMIRGYISLTEFYKFWGWWPWKRIWSGSSASNLNTPGVVLFQSYEGSEESLAVKNKFSMCLQDSNLMLLFGFYYGGLQQYFRCHCSHPNDILKNPPQAPHSSPSSFPLFFLSFFLSLPLAFCLCLCLCLCLSLSFYIAHHFKGAKNDNRVRRPWRCFMV